jgi:hypothetical protein
LPSTTSRSIPLGLFTNSPSRPDLGGGIAAANTAPGGPALRDRISSLRSHGLDVGGEDAPPAYAPRIPPNKPILAGNPAEVGSSAAPGSRAARAGAVAEWVAAQAVSPETAAERVLLGQAATAAEGVSQLVVAERAMAGLTIAGAAVAEAGAVEAVAAEATMAGAASADAAPADATTK